jgi:hypothetical protein
MIIFGLLHIVISSLLAYFASLIYGQLNPLIAFFSLALAAILSFWLINADMNDFKNLQLNRWRKSTTGIFEKLSFAVVIFIAIRHFLFLFYEVDHELRSLHPFNLGDLPLHIHYIRNLASGVSFPPINPNFSAELLRYPFGIDLYNSLYEILGLPTGGHLFLVALFCTLASLVCLRLAGSWVSIVAFFLSGGFISLVQGGSLELSNALSWKNLFLSMFLTQRGFIWALPVGVLLLYFIFLSARKKVLLQSRSLLILGILWGGLAFFHLHSFFMLSLFIGAKVLLRLVRTRGRQIKEDIQKYFYVWIWPLVFGSYFVLISLNFFNVSGVAHWHWGWTIGENESLFSYLVTNFGTYLLLFLGVGFIIFANKKKSYYFEFLIHFILFLVFFNFILAPWNWDNIKVLVWPYLGLSILSFEILRPLWTRWMQVVLAVSLSYGGIYAISGTQFSIAHHIVLYKTVEIAFARAATTQIPVNAIFAAGTSYDHELTALGRSRVMGYEGHLWAHGIQFQDTKAKLTELMQGSEHWLERARELKVNFIYWGPREREEFKGVVNPAWRTQLTNFSRVIDYEVYEIPQP